MKEQIIQHFLQLEKYKVIFSPAIKIKEETHSHPAWIDDMYQVSENYMVTISTVDDSCKRNLNKLDSLQLSALQAKLASMVQDKNKIPIPAMIARHDAKVKATIVEKIR